MYDLYDLYVCMYVYIHMYVYRHRNAHIRTCHAHAFPTFVRTHVSIYETMFKSGTHIHAHAHAHAHTYMHTYIHGRLWSSGVHAMRDEFSPPEIEIVELIRLRLDLAVFDIRKTSSRCSRICRFWLLSIVDRDVVKQHLSIFMTTA